MQVWHPSQGYPGPWSKLPTMPHSPTGDWQPALPPSIPSIPWGWIQVHTLRASHTLFPEPPASLLQDSQTCNLLPRNSKPGSTTSAVEGGKGRRHFRKRVMEMGNGTGLQSLTTLPQALLRHYAQSLIDYPWLKTPNHQSVLPNELVWSDFPSLSICSAIQPLGAGARKHL